MQANSPIVLDQFKHIILYTWDNKTFQVDFDSSCVFNSFNLDAAKTFFEIEAGKFGFPYVKDLTRENFEAAEVEWKEYWSEYMKKHPGVDGFDYVDERECFMMDVFGGDAKHL